MATWVEDIVQALRNLGGQAHRRQIINEVRRIRKGPLPRSLEEIIQRTIQDHSSDSTGFRGNDLFKKVENGVWALRDQPIITHPSQPIIERVIIPPAKEVPSTTESAEMITNLFMTIKEYRAYSNPDFTSWKEYVLDFFHILGFQTEVYAENETEYFFKLRNLGLDNDPHTLLEFIPPNKHLEEFIPDLSRLWLLGEITKALNFNWGVLTNGYLIKVIDVKKFDYDKNYSQWNLEEIIQNERLDSFFTIYKVFSLINGRKEEPVKREIERTPKRIGTPVTKGFDLNYHTHDKPGYIIQLFEALHSHIFSLPGPINEVYNKWYIAYSSPKNFCEILLQKNQLKIWVCISMDEISNHLSLCRDVRKIGHYGTGDTEIALYRIEDVDAVFDVIKQAYIFSTNR